MACFSFFSWAFILCLLTYKNFERCPGWNSVRISLLCDQFFDWLLVWLLDCYACQNSLSYFIFIVLLSISAVLKIPLKIEGVKGFIFVDLETATDSLTSLLKLAKAAMGWSTEVHKKDHYRVRKWSSTVTHCLDILM